MDDGVIFLGQCQSEGKKEGNKGFYVQLKYKVLIQCLSQNQVTSMSATSFPNQFDLEVSSWCEESEDGGFFNCEMCAQYSMPLSFATVSVGRST